VGSALHCPLFALVISTNTNNEIIIYIELIDLIIRIIVNEVYCPPLDGD